MSQPSSSSTPRVAVPRKGQGHSQLAVKSEDNVSQSEPLVLRYLRNQSPQAGRGDPLLTVLVNNKPSYIYLNNGFYGFPEVQNALSRIAKAQVQLDVCFCNPKPSTKNFGQMCFVFCARGVKCNHLVHKTCLGITRQLSEAVYPRVLTSDFVCDACSVVEM
ncbi:hypothetical protein EON65_26080 [archaeon]|nr:MAG: hypothetical protein EON65_26080 [archaeon]